MTMNKHNLKTTLAAVAFATLVPAGAGAQVSRVFEQYYFPADHNWEFRDRYRIADRLFNAFDYGHAILYEVLYTQPGAPASRLELEEFNFITRELLPKPPRLPLEEAAIEVAYVKMAPEAKAMFEWAHVLHRQIYDVLAAEDLSQEEKDAEVAAILRYYKSRPEYAFSSKPKNMELMEGQYYSTAFRDKYPKFNGLIWGYHWLQVGLYEPLMLGRNYGERQTGIAATVTRFFQMIEDAPTNMPRVMPMTAAVAPTFAARYPEAAIIFDNLHSMHDVISDILASPEVPRERKREEILRAAARYRDATSFVMTEAEWRAMTAHMGIQNMGGPPVGFLPAFPVPTLARGAVMAGGDMAGMQHDAPASPQGATAAGHSGHAVAHDTSAHAPDHSPAAGAASMDQMMEIHRRMMSDPVIRDRVATDPVLKSLMSKMDGTHTATATSPEGHAAMTTPDPNARAAMEFVTRLLSDPTIEARIQADPQLRPLWADPGVQQCLATMKRLKASGQPLPSTCPKASPAAPAHKH